MKAFILGLPHTQTLDPATSQYTTRPAGPVLPVEPAELEERAGSLTVGDAEALKPFLEE